MKNIDKVLEIGTYMGHSLLIMLLSNPKLKITCIDISDKYTGPAVNILNKYFNNAIKFIHSDNLSTLQNINENFDFFHIDGYHVDSYISTKFNIIKSLHNSSDNILRVLFDDETCLRQLQDHIFSNYKIIKHINPGCTWSNVYFEIQL